MGLYRAASLFAVLSLAVLSSEASAQTTVEQALARRVDSLERRINELEARLALLERSGTQPPDPTRIPSTGALDIANWRRLRENMSYDAVRRILGEPDRIDGGTVAFWAYPNGGQISFISGRLRSWTEPSR